MKRIEVETLLTEIGIDTIRKSNKLSNINLIIQENFDNKDQGQTGLISFQRNMLPIFEEQSYQVNQETKQAIPKQAARKSLIHQVNEQNVIKQEEDIKPQNENNQKQDLKQNKSSYKRRKAEKEELRLIEIIEEITISKKQRTFQRKQSKKGIKQRQSEKTLIEEKQQQEYEKKKNIEELIKCGKKIIEFLEQRKYKICDYLTSGGQAHLLTGVYYNQLNEEEECVFRIVYYEYGKELDYLKEEIQIMTSLKTCKNISSLINHFILEDNIQVVIFVIEKCQYSLFDEMENLKRMKQNFTFDQLCYIIFNLIDGIVELRQHEIIHQDIKPSNILKNNQNNYVYSDFGCSDKNKDGNAENKGYTPIFCAPEQLNFEGQITYNSDVYSLGQTLKEIIQFYKSQQKNLGHQNNQEELLKLNELDHFINDKMVKKESQQREEAAKLILHCYKIIGKKNQLMQDYLKQKARLSPFVIDFKNKDKDNKYINFILLQYSIIHFEVYIDLCNLGYNLEDIINCNSKINVQSISKQVTINKYLKLLITVAHMYFKIGESQKSQTIRQHSESLLKASTIQPDYQLSNTLFDLGLLCLQARKEQQALDYFEQSIQILQLFIESDHHLIVQIYIKMGYCYSLLVKPDLTLKYYTLSLEMSLRLYKENHKDIANALANIGFHHVRMGDYLNGEKYCKEAYEMRKLIYKDEIHPDITYSLCNLAYCYENIPNYELALKYQQECLDIREKLYFENYFLIAETYVGKANILRNLNRQQDALVAYSKSLQLYKQCYQKKNHLNIAAALNYTGLCYQMLGLFDQAEYYFYYSLWMKQQQYGQVYHQYFATSLNTISVFYFYKGNLSKGLNYTLESYLANISKKDDQTTALSKYRLGVAYLQYGNLEKGLKFSLESLILWKKLYSHCENHIDTAKCLLNVGLSYLKKGYLTEALDNCKESLKMHRALLKGNEINSNIAACLDGLGDCYLGLQKLVESFDCYVYSLRIKQQIFSQNHPEIAKTFFKLGLFYEKISSSNLLN